MTEFKQKMLQSSIYAPTADIIIPKELWLPFLRFVKIQRGTKIPVDLNWQTWMNYHYNSLSINQWISMGGNYGITDPFGHGVSIDADEQEIQNALDSNLPPTFRWSTGQEGHYQYIYYIDMPVSCIPLAGGGYIKGRGGQSVGPGSVHPNGVVYGSREIRRVPIAAIKKTDLLKALEPFIICYTDKNIKHAFQPLDLKGSGISDISTIINTLTPYWQKADTKRNELTLAISGFIARSGGTPVDAQKVIFELCKRTGRGWDHVSGARYAFGRSGPIRGIPTLKRLLEVIAHDSQ